MNTFDERVSLLKKVQQMDFVVVEWTLYTDTHPDDEDALEQWREAIKEATVARKQYENKFGPLSLKSIPSRQALEVGWRWNQDPWPWQL
jgi:spore coat protein JB